VTWDPTFFPASNTTINILASYTSTNLSTVAFSKLLFQSQWGFIPMPVDSSMIESGKGSSNVTFSVQMQSNAGSAGAQTFIGPTVTIANPPGPQPPPPAQAPHGQALYIGLPAAFGAFVLILFGTCLWNRKTRKIGLGNIMSRNRHGYGAGKNRTERMLGRRAGKGNAAIRLEEREVNVPEEQRYHDAPAPGRADSWDAGWQEQVPGRSARTRDGASAAAGASVARRDSDVLGSLAGSPTEDGQMDFGRHQTGNAFRDEISRQDKERF
jgi:hypothetical protein